LEGWKIGLIQPSNLPFNLPIIQLITKPTPYSTNNFPIPSAYGKIAFVVIGK
jgi:hypothetical protein